MFFKTIGEKTDIVNVAYLIRSFYMSMASDIKNLATDKENAKLLQFIEASTQLYAAFDYFISSVLFSFRSKQTEKFNLNAQLCLTCNKTEI